MQNGLYVAASGMLMQQERLDVISNNVANTNTNGFKRELAIASEYRPVDTRNPQNLIRKTLYNKTINATVKLDDIATDFEMGHFRMTGNAFDMALQDTRNFFALETPMGIRYTRDGEFTLNSDGEMVSRNGFNLVDNDTGASIVIPDNTVNVDITLDGTVYADGAEVGRIMVSQFDNLDYLQKVGRNMFAAVGILPQEPGNATVTQGYLESSNVDPIMEMVRMIDSMREYEMHSKVVQTYDTINEQAANSIART